MEKLVWTNKNESEPISSCEIWRICILPSKMQNIPLVCFTKALQSESRLCRLGRSVSKQLCVIICLVEVIILYSKSEHSVDNNIEVLLP